ncbi:hypothetical protein D3C72_1525400 [compost metagenome]
MSPVRCTWVPPQSSTEKPPPMVSTRTCSPYFSPNSAVAPLALAVSMSVSSVSTSLLLRISALTMSSSSFNCSGLMASKWLKSKRRRWLSTSEPFCCTWSPSTRRRAACSRWVAEWFRAVAWRTEASTWAVTPAPMRRVPWSTTPWCRKAPPALVVSRTSKRRPWALMKPQSPIWPPDSA